MEGIGKLPLAIKAAANIQPTYYIADIIHELRSHDWYRQNDAIAVVRNIGPEGLAKLSAEELRLVGNNVLQAADGSARDAASLLGQVAAGEAVWPAAFIEGVISECLVNDKGVVRYKPAHLEVALRCLLRCDPSARAKIVRDVVGRVKAGSPDDWRARPSLKDQTLETLKRVRACEASIAAELSLLEGAVSETPTPSGYA